MNWGAVLFSCVLAPRVCRPAGKNGGGRSEYPRFWAKAPNFSFADPHFSCAAGSVRWAVRSDVQFLAHRVKKVPKRLANRGGWRVEAAGE